MKQAGSVEKKIKNCFMVALIFCLFTGCQRPATDETKISGSSETVAAEGSSANVSESNETVGTNVMVESEESSGEYESLQPISIKYVSDADYTDFQEMNEAVGFDRYLEAAGFGDKEPYYLFEGENNGIKISLELYFDEATGHGCGLEYTRWFSNRTNETEMSIESFEVRNTFEGMWEERDYRKPETYEERYTMEDLVGIWDGNEPEDIGETFEYDEDGRITSYLATGKISEFSDQGDMMLLKFDYEYRDDGSLFRRVYAKNSLVVGGTWFSTVTSLFDEMERVLYEDAYVTHGNYEMFYIYGDDAGRPEYILNIDHYPGPDIDVSMERCKAPKPADESF